MGYYIDPSVIRAYKKDGIDLVAMGLTPNNKLLSFSDFPWLNDFGYMDDFGIHY